MNNYEIMDHLDAHNDIYMSDARREHVRCVSKNILDLIQVYKLNKEECLLVAKGHDVSKELPEEVRKRMMRTWKLKSFAHEDVSAGMMEHMFGVKNKDVLNAVRDHSLCHSNSVLAKVFFVVDCTDVSKREWDNVELRLRVVDLIKKGSVDMAVDLIKAEQRRLNIRAATEAFDLIFD